MAAPRAVIWLLLALRQAFPACTRQDLESLPSLRTGLKARIGLKA
jgi:hypothetical protein